MTYHQHMDGARDPREIRRDIEATQARIQSKIAALRHDVSAEALMGGALDAAGGPRELAHDLSRRVKSKPLPATLTAVGLAWLMMSDRQNVTASSATLHGTTDGTGHPRLDAMRDRTSSAAHRARSATRSLSHSVKDQPLVLGALGLALGALLGGAAPRTRAEDEWIGRASDRARERMQGATAHGAERASEREQAHAQADGASPFDDPFGGSRH